MVGTRLADSDQGRRARRYVLIFIRAADFSSRQVVEAVLGLWMEGCDVALPFVVVGLTVVVGGGGEEVVLNVAGATTPTRRLIVVAMWWSAT